LTSALVSGTVARAFAKRSRHGGKSSKTGKEGKKLKREKERSLRVFVVKSELKVRITSGGRRPCF